MLIAVASQNPVKINASKKAFEIVFPKITFETQGFVTDSKVSDQPITDSETLTGATNRAQQLRTDYPKADYWVGIEGGIELRKKDTECFAWIVALSKNKMGVSRSASFILPEEANKLLHTGKELGDVMDVLHQRENVKQSEGAIGLLTNNLITRTDLYIQPLIIAISQISN